MENQLNNNSNNFSENNEGLRSPLRVQDFDFQVKKRRPLWQRMILFASTFMLLWGTTHVGMNYSAYSQLAEFRIKEFVASVTTPEVSAEPVKEQATKIEKVNGPAKPKSKDSQKVSYSPTLVSYASDLFDAMDAYPSDDRVEIPRIGKNVPLVSVPDHKNWSELERTIQNGLRGGVVVHPVSRDPSSAGNFFVTGHSSYYPWDKGQYKDIFALLHEVEIGDDVIIYWKGKKYEYVIEESKVVLPTEVSVLEQPTDKKILTLMTCTPVGTAEKRLIKIAVPKYNSSPLPEGVLF